MRVNIVQPTSAKQSPSRDAISCSNDIIPGTGALGTYWDYAPTCGC